MALSRIRRVVSLFLKKAHRRRTGSVIDRAIEVIGDRDEAFRWLGTPVPELGFRAPIALASTKAGEKAVLDVLGRLEHGVY
jgi:putative toxin-antitoxin system antitoxin component (TIGR02293 family)